GCGRGATAESAPTCARTSSQTHGERPAPLRKRIASASVMSPSSRSWMSPVCHYFGVNRTDRLFAIREELRGAGPAGRTAERLAEVFEVSVRTIKRDVAALQQAGFPVWARPGR